MKLAVFPILAPSGRLGNDKEGRAGAGLGLSGRLIRPLHNLNEHVFCRGDHLACGMDAAFRIGHPFRVHPFFHCFRPSIRRDAAFGQNA
jgi:hypothetical protein